LPNDAGNLEVCPPRYPFQLLLNDLFALSFT
jgi:hypothetical protein